MIETYAISPRTTAGYAPWVGGQEAMLRFGPADGPVVVASPALFEEANRSRAFLVTILRALAARGIASALPDLPGTGESLTLLEEVHPFVESWASFDAVQAAAAGRPVYGLTIRGGALTLNDQLLKGVYQLSPVDGERQVQELIRAGRAGRPVPDPAFEAAVERVAEWPINDSDLGPILEIAGNRIPALKLALLSHRPFLKEPEEGDPAFVRTVRLEGDPAPADRYFPGVPQWRRAEPDNDPSLAALLADDIAAWVRQCEG